MQLHGVGAPGSVPPSGLLRPPLVPPARPAWAQLGHDPFMSHSRPYKQPGSVWGTCRRHSSLSFNTTLNPPYISTPMLV